MVVFFKYPIAHLSMNIHEGTRLVKIARSALHNHLIGECVQCDIPGGITSPPQGAFVTLKTYPDHDLRGCIGRLPPTQRPLEENIINAAIDAGLTDTRFNPVQSADDLNHLLFEVTVLSPFRALQAQSYDDVLTQITLGQDGLFLQHRNRSAIFLPQVPIEQNWSKDQYYTALCHKAGIDTHTCKDMSQTRVAVFQGEIFAEKVPRGDIHRVTL